MFAKRFGGGNSEQSLNAARIKSSPIKKIASINGYNDTKKTARRPLEISGKSKSQRLILLDDLFLFFGGIFEVL